MHNRDSAVFTSNVCKYWHRTQHSWSMTSVLAFRLRVWMYHRLDTKKSQITALCYKNNHTTTYIALEITTKIKSQTPPATIYLQKLPDDDSSKSSLRKTVHLSRNHPLIHPRHFLDVSISEDPRCPDSFEFFHINYQSQFTSIVFKLNDFSWASPPKKKNPMTSCNLPHQHVQNSTHLCTGEKVAHKPEQNINFHTSSWHPWFDNNIKTIVILQAKHQSHITFNIISSCKNPNEFSIHQRAWISSPNMPCVNTKCKDLSH